MWTNSSHRTVAAHFLEQEAEASSWYTEHLESTLALSKKLLLQLTVSTASAVPAQEDNSGTSRDSFFTSKVLSSELTRSHRLFSFILNAKKQRDKAYSNLLIAKQLSAQASAQDTCSDLLETREDLEYQLDRKESHVQRIQHYVDVLQAETFVLNEKRALSLRMTATNLRVHRRLEDIKAKIKNKLFGLAQSLKQQQRLLTHKAKLQQKLGRLADSGWASCLLKSGQVLKEWAEVLEAKAAQASALQLNKRDSLRTVQSRSGELDLWQQADCSLESFTGSSVVQGGSDLEEDSVLAVYIQGLSE